ncbi:WG containing repeat-containing protein [Paenibacillus sp. OK060]|uniref:WG repeat-containing protein n=1 Tax=Paenibacillus sp. OK060 TaxID=1881034 RepID=UPI0008892960|nr:WG repeat-containing protein [Paenibacillus sp. OK060]SDM47397.1 WG containing repeat-containing protein [Paenibacillus sp. OK060]
MGQGAGTCGFSHLWFTDRAAIGLIPVRQNWKWGFINYQGKFVINPQFQLARDAFKVIAQDKSIEYIGLFNNELAIAKKNGKIGYLNNKGEFLSLLHMRKEQVFTVNQGKLLTTFTSKTRNMGQTIVFQGYSL